MFVMPSQNLHTEAIGMRIDVGLGLGIGWRFGDTIDRRWTIVGLRLVIHAIRYPRNWFRDRPDVTSTSASERESSPLFVGHRLDRIGS